MSIQVNGLLGLIFLAAVIWAVLNIFQSAESNGKKVLWTLVVVAVPVFGFLIWLFLGPRGAAR